MTRNFVVKSRGNVDKKLFFKMFVVGSMSMTASAENMTRKNSVAGKIKR